MPRKYGKDSNFKGIKGRSGDKPDSVKFRAMIDTGLANAIMNEELAKIKESKVRKHIELKDFVMPLALKGMGDKIDLTSKGESIKYTDEQIRAIAKRVIPNGGTES